MDLDKDDLAVLRQGLTADEVDRLHRLLHEWNLGPENSFPVQLTLLTVAQLRAAASVPRSITDSRKWLEQHLAEYRRQTKLLLEEAASTTRQQQAEMKTALAGHAKSTSEAAAKFQARYADAEAVAERVQSLMDRAVSEWRTIKAATKAEGDRLQQVSNALQNRFAWQELLWGAIWYLTAIGLGLFMGHYCWPR
jgi:DNA repair exonuclease SbcCD ATPase subunit